MTTCIFLLTNFFHSNYLRPHAQFSAMYLQRYSEPSRNSNRIGSILAHATSDWKMRMPMRNGV